MARAEPPLVVGIGCQRQTPAEALEHAVSEVLAQHGLALASVCALATSARKRDEAGLRELAAKRGIEVTFFADERLAAVTTPSASRKVAEHVGTTSVAEAAALLKSSARMLLVPKTVVAVGEHAVTVAVARLSKRAPP